MIGPGAAARWMGAAVLTGILAAGLAVGSLLPLPGEAPTEGMVRLDWRLRGEEAGPCPRPTEEALQALPPHMRNPDACLGALPPYRLRIRVDGDLLVDEVVRGGGARGDRPLTVFRELHLSPGIRDVDAEFVRDDGESGGVELRAEGRVDLEAGRIVLVVRRQDTGELEIRSPAR